MRYCCLVKILFFIFTFSFSFGAINSYGKAPLRCQNVHLLFKKLVNDLTNDGFNRDEICKIYSDKRVKFNPKVMPRKVTHKESKLHYDIFLEEKRIKRAQRYLRENKTLFTAIEQEYGIPKEIKVAILLVETDLGRYLGSSLAINTLSSMAVAKNFDTIKDYLPNEYKGLSKKEIARLNKKLAKKSSWAYSELKSLLIYARQNKLDILKIKGSIFGAIGLCQFMPSNALKFGVDYNKDGKVDLFDPADAIASMANYLRYYGWKPNSSLKRQLRVIMHYNHSTPYAKTVIRVAQKVSSS